jgi:hypothetical protein
LSLPQHLLDKARSLVRASDVARGQVVLKPKKTPQARALEALGYEPWAMKLGHRTFKKPFSPFHHRFWRWYWLARLKLLAGEKLTADELAALLVWGRGLGKSSHVEWACIAEGALGEGVVDEPGYVGYICADADLAKGHIQSIRNRLDSPEISHFYPGLANPRVDIHGYQTAWRQNYLATRSGWGIIPIGLKEGVRGGRLFDLRFTMFVFDDIDNRKYSADVIKKNLDIIAYEILPAGTPQTLKLFPQNLVREDGVLAQILNRESDVLSRREVIGTEEGEPQPAFEEVELEPDERRPGAYKIRSAVPVWEGFDVAAAEVFLADSGKAGFLAEYQHDLEGERTENVLPNWCDEVHVITRSEFERVFGTRTIPYYWGRRWFNDWAKTKTAKHANVAGCLSVSAQNTEFPGAVFLSDCLSFPAGTEADEVAMRIIKTVSPTVMVQGRARPWAEVLRDAHMRTNVSDYSVSITDMIEKSRDVRARIIPPLVRGILQAQRLNCFRGSHEQNNNALEVYRSIYGLPFAATNPGADGGVELLNSLMKVDRSHPHPFKRDERQPDGTFRLGFSRFFLVAEDDAAAPPPANANPRSLHDSALARYQLRRWRNLPVKDSETGEVERGPEKRNDDFGNGLMMCAHDGLPVAVPLSYNEKLQVASPRLRELTEKVGKQGGLTPGEEMSYWFARTEAKKRVGHGGIRRFDEWGDPYPN